MSLNSYPSNTCPEHLQLLALAEGTLTDVEATIVSEHVSACRACDVKLGAIEEQSDDLVRALSMLPATDDDEATFQSLQAKLLATPEPFGDGNGRTDTFFTDLFRTDVPADLALPIKLGNYELLEQIGVGANGAVFRARHRRLEKQVAVKLLLNVAAPAVEEFLNEMRIIGKLDHPNVVQATDAGEHDGIYFLVMEFVPGLDVSSLLRKHGPLSTADACEIARQTALGLSVAHQNDLVHRDVKTSNLLFTAAGQVKLLDLGLATISSRSREVPTDQSGPRGTADYMAPEQWREASTVTAKADIYSLGCTLYKLLTGAPPFRPLPESVATLEEAHLRGEIPSSLGDGRNLPSSLDAFIRRMLSKDPADRPDSAGVVADQLAKYTAGADLPKLARAMLPDAVRPTDIAAPVTLPQFGTRRNALVAILAGLGVIAWKMNHRSSVSQPISTGQWRKLSPVIPQLIPLGHEDGEHQGVEDYASLDVHTEITVESPQPLLVHFGRPLTGVFRYRAVLKRDWSTNGGIFFRLRADQPRSYQFQTLEVLRSESKWWLYWNSYTKNIDEPPIPLAGTHVKANDSDEVELSIGLGVSGFPHFFFDGQRIPQSAWTVTKEARDLTTAHFRQLATRYTGHIGVLHLQGSTVIRSPQLMYIKQE